MCFAGSQVLLNIKLRIIDVSLVFWQGDPSDPVDTVVQRITVRTTNKMLKRKQP